MSNFEGHSRSIAVDLDAVVSDLQQAAEIAASQARWGVAAALLEEAALAMYRNNPRAPGADRLMLCAGLYRDREQS